MHDNIPTLPPIPGCPAQSKDFHMYPEAKSWCRFHRQGRRTTLPKGKPRPRSITAAKDCSAALFETDTVPKAFALTRFMSRSPDTCQQFHFDACDEPIRIDVGAKRKLATYSDLIAFSCTKATTPKFRRLYDFSENFGLAGMLLSTLTFLLVR
jgi:hypothetical protein